MRENIKEKLRVSETHGKESGRMVIKLEKIKALLYENGSAVIRNADIYIKDDRIFKVDTTMQAQDAPKADKIIDGKDRLAIPGLINAHTHAYMSVFRNIAVLL